MHTSFCSSFLLVLIYRINIDTVEPDDVLCRYEKRKPLKNLLQIIFDGI